MVYGRVGRLRKRLLRICARAVDTWLRNCPTCT